MDRRLIGALLLVAVIAAAVTVPYSAGLRIAGSATVIDVPADPRVGDCLLEPAAPVGSGSTGAGPAGAGPVEPATRPASSAAPGPFAGRAGSSRYGVAPKFGPCDGSPVAGEVVTVMPVIGADWLRRIQIQAYGDDCRSASLAAAGLVQLDGRYVPPALPPADPVSWRLSINLKSGWMLPSAFLQAAGRSWAACVVTSSTGRPYQGRITGAFDGGKLPNEFGTCWNSRTVSASIEAVDCGAPHLAELISAGFVPNAREVTDSQVKGSCESLTALVLGRDDPTAGAELTIKTSPESLLLSDNANTSASVLCYVIPTAERELVGTLVGLGPNPIPYAG